MTHTLLLAVASAAAWCSAAHAQGFSPEDARKRMVVPPGFSVKVFASEPEVRQPVAMHFDDRGRLWVVQYIQYPTPAGLTAVKVDRYLRTVYDKLPEPPPKGPKGNDKITILEDADGDGRFDSVKEFVTGLNLATGVATGYGGVFVLQSPYLLFYPDRNRDDIPDGDPEVLLTGFGMEDAHAFAGHLNFGPDGWLYGTQGSTVTANIRGIVFQQGIWRYHPRTKEFELFSEGGGNTWGLDFDRNGNVIAGTNHGGVAMLHQVQGAYFVKNFGKHGELQNPHAYGFFNHVPYTGFKGGHVTCGGVVYQGGAYPDEYNDQYIAANLLSNALYWHRIEPNKSTFTNRWGGDFLIADDTWFRPVDCVVGPDGSVFTADWTDKRATHVDPKDDWDRTNGRIYKIEYQGTRPVTGLDLSKLPSRELVGMLTHTNAYYSRHARRLLAERRDASVIPDLLKTLAEKKPGRAAVESLWALNAVGGFDEARAADLLAHPDEYVRAWTIQLLGDAKTVTPDTLAILAKLARTDPSAVVRCRLACSAKRLPGLQCLKIARSLIIRNEDVDDPYIPMLIWWAFEDKAISDIEEVLSIALHPDAWKYPLFRGTLAQRLARRWASAGTDASLAACAALLASTTEKANAELVIDGMDKGIEGRKFAAVPAPLAKPLAEQWIKGDPSPALVRLAATLGSKAAVDRARARAVDPRVGQPERLGMIDLLGRLAPPEAAEPLTALMGPNESKAVRTAAMSAVARYTDPKIAAALLEQYPRLPEDLKVRARTVLFGRSAWALAFLKSVDAGRFDPKTVPVDQLRSLSLHGIPEIDALVAKHWGKIGAETDGAKRARIGGIVSILKLTPPGEASRGKELFVKHCAVCHTLFGQGNKIGPDLTGADRKNTDFMLTNIVDPSAVIRKEFMAYQVLTTDARILVGLLVEETPNAVTLLDAKNVKTTISRADIEAMKPAAESLMPEKQLDALDPQQIRDLFVYLRSDAPAPVPPK